MNRLSVSPKSKLIGAQLHIYWDYSRNTNKMFAYPENEFQEDHWSAFLISTIHLYLYIRGYV